MLERVRSQIKSLTERKINILQLGDGYLTDELELGGLIKELGLSEDLLKDYPVVGTAIIIRRIPFIYSWGLHAFTLNLTQIQRNRCLTDSVMPDRQ